ncbi:hypothetical protein WJX75_006609 [Coccomyxa subellipsoidea]|uniref:Protein kinase domain-containing protein n=1 Tax=Coccomyxa subellipsoidea TaxID=248742 RepID=A0ABR2Z0J4_9CHLO
MRPKASVSVCAGPESFVQRVTARIEEHGRRIGCRNISDILSGQCTAINSIPPLVSSSIVCLLCHRTATATSAPGHLVPSESALFRLRACERRQCTLIGELTDIQRLLLAHGLQMLGTGNELPNLPSLETQSCRWGGACSEDGGPSTASSSESEGLETPPLLGAHKPLSRQRLPKRASSAPLDGGSGLLGLHLGRLVGRGSFGRVYKGSWAGRPVAVKVMCHEGSTANVLNALQESLVAKHVQHKNVVATYSVHTVERPVGEDSWCLYRSASLGRECRGGSSRRAATRKLEAGASETASPEFPSAKPTAPT